MWLADLTDEVGVSRCVAKSSPPNPRGHATPLAAGSASEVRVWISSKVEARITESFMFSTLAETTKHAAILRALWNHTVVMQEQIHCKGESFYLHRLIKMRRGRGVLR